MISKKSKNTGSSGGNGMQEFTIDYLMYCDLYLEYKKGHVSSCPHCGEEYHLNPDHNYIESLKLSIVMKEDGCPFCNHKGGLTREYLEWFVVNKGKVLQFDFEIEQGKLVSTCRKPYGWKSISKTQLREAWEDKQAA
jgi:hypothetical protein